MSSVTVVYPFTPQKVDERIIQPSPAFKQEVFRTLLAIVFFIMVYVVLMAAAVGLAILCGMGGFLMIVNLPRIYTIMIGIGLIGLGVMVVFFLMKFLFKRNKIDLSHLIEVTEKDQPELFHFVRRLTKETQAPFPKKIYLSSDVNASVFYDSSFWSMFFPVRKNLQIGLGLVNAVNISEFKAILAHEFGHFSQRSMKLGSYVYNVNKVIYNLLYDNEGYGSALERWADLNGYFAFFASITIKIVVGIQWILQKVYAVVNKTYMSLSRQMEFHADAVAAYVSGSQHLVTSLRRLEVADTSYQQVVACYQRWFNENLKPDNLYPQHVEVMEELSAEYNIPLENGLPQVTAETFAHFNKTRVIIKDQWASHPSTDDREEHLKQLGIETEAIHLPAWTVFRDKETLQKRMTEKVFETFNFPQAPQVVDASSFRGKYRSENEKYRIDKAYKGFFNYRNITTVNLKKIEERVTSPSTLNDVLDAAVIHLPFVINGLRTDIEILESIEKGQLQVKTFEFQGRKYKKAEVASLLQKVREELPPAEAALQQADTTVIGFFIKAAGRKNESEKLREQYSELFQITQQTESDLKYYAEVMQDISPVFYQSLPFDQIRQIMHKVRLNEVMIKERLKAMLDGGQYEHVISTQDRQRLLDYLAKDHVYFIEPNFNNEALGLFTDAMQIFAHASQDRLAIFKKELLAKQLSYLD
jgi:Zn-dependent protease with chaperone function